jgi:hypothetical protein
LDAGDFARLAGDFEGVGLDVRADPAPPAAVGGVERVGPRGEADGVVDADDAEAAAGAVPGAPDALDVVCGEAGTAAEADDDASGIEPGAAPAAGSREGFAPVSGSALPRTSQWRAEAAFRSWVSPAR